MIAWGGVRIAPDRSTAPGDFRPFLPAISAPAAPDAASPQILVVENHPSLQIVTRNMLAGLGARALVSPHGGEVYSIACATEIDLILMDLQVPTLEGLNSIRQIRRFEQEHARSHVPVVAYTAPGFSCSSFLLSLGFDDILDKPSSAQTLQQCLLTWLPAGRVVGKARAPGCSLAAQPV